MYIDPIELDYHSPVYSGCSHPLAVLYDGIPLVQRLFRLGYCDFNREYFTPLAAFPFKQPEREYAITMLSFPHQLLTINHELDYNSFHSLN